MKSCDGFVRVPIPKKETRKSRLGGRSLEMYGSPYIDLSSDSGLPRPGKLPYWKKLMQTRRIGGGGGGQLRQKNRNKKKERKQEKSTTPASIKDNGGGWKEFAGINRGFLISSQINDTSIEGSYLVRPKGEKIPDTYINIRRAELKKAQTNFVLSNSKT